MPEIIGDLNHITTSISVVGSCSLLFSTVIYFPGGIAEALKENSCLPFFNGPSLKTKKEFSNFNELSLMVYT